MKPFRLSRRSNAPYAAGMVAMLTGTEPVGSYQTAYARGPSILRYGDDSGRLVRVTRHTMDWRRMGRLVVTAHTAEVPNDQEWGDYMAQVDAYLPLSGQRILVVSAGGGPNGPQRKMMTDALNGAKVPVAILTNSMMMRGAGIAVSWFNPSLKVFGPDGLDTALDYLDLTPWERTESVRVLKELEEQLGIGVVRGQRAS